jgi:hypothetical protein
LFVSHPLKPPGAPVLSDKKWTEQRARETTLLR